MFSLDLYLLWSIFSHMKDQVSVQSLHFFIWFLIIYTLAGLASFRPTLKSIFRIWLYKHHLANMRNSWRKRYCRSDFSLRPIRSWAWSELWSRLRIGRMPSVSWTECLRFSHPLTRPYPRPSALWSMPSWSRSTGSKYPLTAASPFIHRFQGLYVIPFSCFNCSLPPITLKGVCC